MKSTKNLILYKNFENGKLFYNMAWIMENYENEYYNREDIEALLYECFNQLFLTSSIFLKPSGSRNIARRGI